MQEFKKGVERELGYYVYLLIDPRNGQTFYVGKGKGNRVFAHVNDQLATQSQKDIDSQKLNTIRDIRLAQLEPIHIIHRHGMSEETALAVESALIDYVPGLTNQIAGQGSELGPANVKQLNDRYAPDVLVPEKNHKLLYIKVKHETYQHLGSVYEATRASWKVSIARANRADYVLAIIDGMCKGVFADCTWREWGDGRYGFDSIELDDSTSVGKTYLNKQVPETIQKRGAQNPIKYGY